MLRRDDHVAARHQREPGADRGAVDRADHRERAVAQRPEAVAHDAPGVEEVDDAVVGHLLPAVAPRRVVEVDAAAEHALAGGGEDRHVRVGAVTQLGERLLDLPERLGVQRVDRRAVEGDRGDAVLDLDVDVLQLSAPVQSLSDAEDGDRRHRGGTTDVVRECDTRAVDLVGRLAAQLLEQLDALRDAGGARRMALGLQPAARVHGEPPAHRGLPRLDERGTAEAVAEPEVLVVDELDTGEAVVHLGDVDVGRSDARHRVRLPRGLHRRRERRHVGLVLVHHAVESEPDAPYPHRPVGVAVDDLLADQQQRGGAVALGRAVVEAERLDDGRRVQDVLDR